MQENKPVAINALSTEGVQFFTHVMAQKPPVPQ
jgi:hypothetical protein